MQLEIIAIGRMKKGADTELYERYFSRMLSLSTKNGFSLTKIYEVLESRASDSLARKKEEGQKILKLIKDEDFLILLDEGGKNLTSTEFAQLIGYQRDNSFGHNSGRMVFAIGGADGHDKMIKSRANLFLSFGKMTWPHQIVRILLAEQLYRAMTILANHPYHRQ